MKFFIWFRSYWYYHLFALVWTEKWHWERGFGKSFTNGSKFKKLGNYISKKQCWLNNSISIYSTYFILFQFGWWANPIFSKKGDYPEIMKDRIERFSYFENLTCSRLPKFTKAEIKFIRGSADFLGLNHYTTYLVSGDERPINSMPSHEKDVGVLKEQDEKWEPSSASWLRVVPWGFKKLLIWIKEKYDNPLIYITENGFADKGELKDTRRINYHAVHLYFLWKVTCPSFSI